VSFVTTDNSPARDLLDLMVGPFRAYAIYTAAKLGIADRLAGGPRTSAALAGRLAPTLTRWVG
jgi:hypothetical protein